jgi:hypothetical protein
MFKRPGKHKMRECEVVQKIDNARSNRGLWVAPELKRLDAGSAEAVSTDGVPDGGGPGTSRS